MTLRLLVVHNTPSTYIRSFYTALAQQPDVVARTIFLARGDRIRPTPSLPRDPEFDYRLLHSVSFYISRYETPLYFHWGLWREMRRFRPTVLVMCGYNYLATLEVLAFARLHSIPTVLWSGSHLRSGFIHRRWANAYKRAVIGRFDAYLAYGSAAKEQLIFHGAAADRIVVGCNTVDVHWYRERADMIRRIRPSSKATQLLYVGRLAAAKNTGALISAVGNLQRRGFAVRLTLAGNGPDRHLLEQQVHHEGLRDVSFLGYLSGDALIQAYVNADALVLPSKNEPWGLVVNEAAACGIPSVVSTLCGAAPDLIIDGESGFVFDPNTPSDLERVLEGIALAPQMCVAMGSAAQRFIMTRDPSYYAARLIEAANLAASKPKGAPRSAPAAMC